MRRPQLQAGQACRWRGYTAARNTARGNVFIKGRMQHDDVTVVCTAGQMLPPEVITPICTSGNATGTNTHEPGA
jgi:hypothetical protein